MTLTRYARLLPERRRYWPGCYHGKLYRVLDQHDPSVRDAAGYIWIETPWKAEQSVWGEEFEFVEDRG